MKNIRWMVLLMCMAWLLSLFGCAKGHRVDGPDMERPLWQEFSIWQRSDDYSQHFSYTVKYDRATNKAYLYTEVYDEQKGYPVDKQIKLKEKTVEALLAMNILAFSDVIPSETEAELLDGTFLYFSVTDENGTIFKKNISAETKKEILDLITPYVQEG